MCGHKCSVRSCLMSYRCSNEWVNYGVDQSGSAMLLYGRGALPLGRAGMEKGGQPRVPRPDWLSAPEGSILPMVADHRMKRGPLRPLKGHSCRDKRLPAVGG